MKDFAFGPVCDVIDAYAAGVMPASARFSHA
jgi:hypothetical protein